MQDAFKKKDSFKQPRKEFDMDLFVGGLRKFCNSVQVTKAKIVEFVEDRGVYFPGTLNTLIASLETKFGTVSFTAGEPPRTETYITLPSSNKIPSEIAERTAAIATSRFADMETIPIDAMLAALTEEGIDAVALGFDPPVYFFRSLPHLFRLESSGNDRTWSRLRPADSLMMQTWLHLLRDKGLSAADPETAAGILKKHDITPHKRDVPAFCTVMMCQALVANRKELAALLFALTPEQKREGALYDAVREGLLGTPFEKHMGKLMPTLETFLCHADVDEILPVLKICSAVARPFESYFSKERYSTISKDVTDPAALAHYVIAYYDNPRCCKLLHRYAEVFSRHRLRTVTLMMNMLFYDDPSWVTYFDLLRPENDQLLPSNFLAFNERLFSRADADRFDGYWRVFINHVIRRGVFCDKPEHAHAFYNAVKTVPKHSTIQWALPIALADSRGEIAELYRDALANNEGFHAALEKNSVVAIRLMIAMLATPNEEFDTLREPFAALRQRAANSRVRRDKAVLYWLDELLDAKGASIDGEMLLSASLALLKTYPDIPSPTTVDTVLHPMYSTTLPPYRALWHYLNTYNSDKEIEALDEAWDTYLNKHDLPSGSYARKEIYLTLTLLTEYMLRSSARRLGSLHNYPFLCRKYAVLKKLVGDGSALPEGLETVLHQIDEWDSYERFAMALDAFTASVPDEEPWREKILYATVSNYWDKTLDELLCDRDSLSPYHAELSAFLSHIAARGALIRRFLQLLLYSELGARIASGEAADDLPARKKSEVRDTARAFADGTREITAYREAISSLANILVPDLASLIRFSDGADRETLFGIELVLDTKHLANLKARLPDLGEHTSFERVLLPCIVLTHVPEHIDSLTRHAILKHQPVADVLLANGMVRAALGEITASYYDSLHHALSGDFDTAAALLPPEIDCVAAGHKTYAKLRRAIETRESIDPAEFARKGTPLPPITFSFMERADDQGADAARLASDFYSEGIFTTAEKCLTARKIYSFVLGGGKWTGFDTLAFTWGFLEIEREPLLERKIAILLEMLEKLSLLQNKHAFCTRFAARFAYIASELPPHLFTKLFPQLSRAHDLLYHTFDRYEHRDCYATLMALLGEAVALMKDTARDNAETLEQLKLIRSRVIAAQQSFEQNAFAARATELLEKYVLLVTARGTFEVKLLNADRTVDGTHYPRAFCDTVFYQIKNVGFERVLDLTLTFSVKGHEASTVQIRPAEILEAGLGPGCVFAGEYTPKLSFTPARGSDVEISVWIEHTEKSEDGKETLHRYEAVRGAVEGKLTACDTPPSPYRKKGSAGYLTSLKWREHLIGREEELDSILGALSNGENVLLYGTNGTGKSSILHHIKNHGLLGEIFPCVGDRAGYAAHLVSAKESCTERDLLATLLLSLGTPKEEVEAVFDGNACADDTQLLSLFDAANAKLQGTCTVACVLVDQFERVVASQDVRPELWQALMEKRHSNLCYVLAGSNEVLYEVATARDLGKSAWRDVFRPFAQIKIGNLGKEAFRAFLTQPRALNGGELTYTEEAISYLWSYTNGHALYSVLYGNRTLDVMSGRGVRRDVIYPGDVFAAIHATEDQAVENDIGGATASTVWAQIFRNMESDTSAMLVGKTLAKLQAEGEHAVSLLRLVDALGEMAGLLEPDVRAALDVLQARDFVTADGEQGRANGAVMRYRFRSDLYLEHFLTYNAKAVVDEDTDKRKRLDHLVSSTAQALRLGSLSMDQLKRLSAAIPDEFKLKVGKYYGKGAIDQSQNLYIENLTVNHVSASVDALRSLLAGDAKTDEKQVAQCLEAFPRLSLRAPGAKIDMNDELGHFDVDGYVDAVSEGVKRSLLAEEGKKTEDGGLPHYTSLIQWAKGNMDKLNGFTEGDLEYLCSKEIEDKDREGILVALYLRSLFDDIPRLPNVTLDYSPVTISMCKALERILTAYHYPLYSDEKITKLTIFRHGAYKKCINRGEPWIPAPIKLAKEPTIGTFATVLMTMFHTYPLVDPDIQDKNEARESFVAKTKASEEEWTSYAENLNAVTDIRNHTAHVRIVTQDECDTFISYYFEKKLLEQTRRYAATDL